MFGIAIVCYLFLGGLGGAVSSIAAAIVLLAPKQALRDRRWKPFSALLLPLACVAEGCLVAAGLCLLADSGRFEALGYLFFSQHPTILTVGAWLIVAQSVLCLFEVLVWFSPAGALARCVRTISALAVLTGFAVVLYSAFYLYGLQAVPLWHSAWLPPLFVASSYSAGFALAGAVSMVRGSDQLFRSLIGRFAVADLVMIILEAACAAGFFLAVSSASGRPGAAGEALAAFLAQLAQPPLSYAWWGGFVFLGIVVPLFLNVASAFAGQRATRKTVMLAICAAALAGSFALRLVIIVAGTHPVLGF